MLITWARIKMLTMTIAKMLWLVSTGSTQGPFNNDHSKDAPMCLNQLNNGSRCSTEGENVDNDHSKDAIACLNRLNKGSRCSTKGEDVDNDQSKDGL